MNLDLRSAMVDRPGAVLRLVFRRFFRSIRFDEDAARRIHAAAARGPLVYVLQTVSYMEFLYFNYILRLHGLPLARFANGAVRTVLLWPLHITMRILFGIWRLARSARLESEEDAMVRRLQAGDAVLLFLRPGRGIVERGEAAKVRGRFVETLIAAHRRQGARIQLVPMTLLWGRGIVRPGGRGALDALFGDPEAPGRLRAFWLFLRHYRDSVVKVAEPIDLGSFLGQEELAGRSDDALARALRFELSGAIERERRAVQGPPAKNAARVRADVMRSRALNDAIEEVAREKGKSREEVVRQAEKTLREIAARPHPWAFAFMKRLLDFVFDRIYDGIDIDRAGLARLRELGKHGPLVLLPSHKSHIDYLVLSYVFYLNDLPCPHVASGSNLAFFPLGFLFRRVAAFFIRRSFRGDALYAAVLSAYVKRLLRDGFHVEFFIEGGRSRTGKLLPPRLGLLGMVADSRAQLVPIAINYEKVVEEGSYARESAGQEKKKESLGALLRARRVLRSQYGRIDLQIGEPIAHSGEDVPPESDEAARKQYVLRLGHRVRWGIAQATAVTPSALVAAAALAGGGRALPRRELDRNLGWLAKRARAAGARFAASLEGDFEGGIQRAIDLLQSDGDLELRGIGDDELVVLPEERRARLEFYKNHGLHVFSEASIVARAFQAAAGDRPGVETHDVKARALTASRLLKLELVYQPGGRFDEVFARTLADLAADGWLRVGDARLEVTADGKAALAVFAGLTASYLEAYRLVVKTAQAHPKLATKDLVGRAATEGEKALLLGDLPRREAISRPYFENAVSYLDEAGAFEDRGRLAATLDELQSIR